LTLQKYKTKRNFKATPEPAGKLKKTGKQLIFTVQRHKASHLHYDFRLELDGVLKSWAVPKGPSLNPQDKRLAMMVEDHPYSYHDFAGVIPEGNYGAGIVEVWDHGTVTDIDQSDSATAEKNLKAGLKAGNLKFVLKGKKLKGEFALVKMKGREENTWLLIKHRDKYAVDEPYDSEAQTPKNSPINKWLATHGDSAIAKTRLKRGLARPVSGKKTSSRETVPIAMRTVKKKRVRALPGETRKLSDFIHPMLAKETDIVFSDPDWIYEIKWDGYRAIAEVNGKRVSLYSRNGNTFNDSYPIVTEALKKQNIHAVLDGEIAVLDEKGFPSFQLLQFYDSDPEHPIQYYVFDVLSINGTDTCDLPLVERKKLLKKLLKKSETVKYSDHIEGDGEAFFEAAKKQDLEGIMAKKADSLYHPGVRTNEWLKIKHHKSMEAIIAGFTEPTGSRKYFGALVLGVLKNGELKYIGHTGSGFTHQSLKEMNNRLLPLIQKQSPFKERVKTNMPVTWVKPVLVCEIKYTEVTRDGILRHPIFLHLREDKTANEITMETTKTSKRPVTKATKKPAAKQPTKKVATRSGIKTPAKKTAARSVVKASVKKAGAKKIAAKKEAATAGNELFLDNIKVPVTNLHKVFWPKEKLTKGDVINYYQSIADYILPYLKNRPQSLLRTPNGIDKPAFYHKDAGEEAPDWVENIPVFSESANKDIHYILCNNRATLAYMNNLGCIEINPWHSTTKALDNPDYLVIDLDPSEKNTFEQVIETANVVKAVMDKAGADCYCKTSGATGLHVYVPMQKKYTYDEVKNFAQLICMLTQEQLPSFTTLERNLKKRGASKIYLDHLQNRRGQTIACAYSLRPKAGATVSAPLLWKEVKPGLSPLNFTIHNMLKRIEKTGDLFTAILGKGVDLMKCLKNLEK
jgi:bifunctional non-homologous end joining protein LigD